MPLPVAISTGTVTGTYLRGDGTPLTGRVALTPHALLAGAGVVIPVEPVILDLDGDGHAVAVVAATDDTDLTPAGWRWLVNEVIEGRPARAFYIAVPMDAVVNLATVQPVQPPVTFTPTVRTVMGVGPDTQGDVALPAVTAGIAAAQGAATAAQVTADAASATATTASMAATAAATAAGTAQTTATTAASTASAAAAVAANAQEVADDATETAATAAATAANANISAQSALTTANAARAALDVAIQHVATDHGLIADGTTNNQPALQTLVNTLGTAYVADGRPRVIFFPAGVYAFKDAGTVWKSGVSARGAGIGTTRFLLSNPGNPSNPTPWAAYTEQFHGASTSAPLTDCYFSEFEIDGSGVNISPYTTGMKAFVLQYMLRGGFKNLHLHHCGSTALGCDYLQDVVIDGVIAHHNGRLNNGDQPGGAGIGIGIGGWGAVERTTVVNCVTHSNGAHGIFVELQNNAWARPRGIRIIGCHSEGNKRGISDWGADGLLVSGCTLTGNTAAGFDISNAGVGTTVGRNGLLIGCHIDHNGTDGVTIGDGVTRYRIAHNMIHDNGRHGVHIVNPLLPAAVAQEVVVTDNDVWAHPQNGVRVAATFTDGAIRDNRVRNNGTDTTKAADLRAGVAIAAACNSPAIVGNRVWDNQAVKTQTYGINVLTPGAIGSGMVQNNNLNGNLTAAYTASAGVVTGGMWNENAGIAVGATTSAQTSIVDGPEYVNGGLRWLAATRKWNSGALAPGAGANADGASVVCSPTSGQLGFSALTMIRAVFTGTFVAETATVTATVTFSDNTTATATITATAASTQVGASGTLLALVKDGLHVKTYTVSLKSSIAGSVVAAAVDLVAAQN